MASTPTVARAGRESGRRIRQKKPNDPQPSIDAASSSSLGMLLKNGRRMTTVRGRPKAASGRAIPSGLSSSPRSRTRMNRGRIATAAGNSRPSVNRVYRTSRPGKVRRAKTNAARAANRTTSDRREARDDRAVGQLPPEAWRGQRVRVVRGDPWVREPDRVVGDLRRVLEAAEDRIDDRHDDDGGHQQEDAIADDRRDHPTESYRGRDRRSRRGGHRPRRGLRRRRGDGGGHRYSPPVVIAPWMSRRSTHR